MSGPDHLPAATTGKSAADVARECAREAAEIMMARFGPGLHPEEMITKGRGNFVTETDLACERATIDHLAREYPGYPVLSEETFPARRDDWDRGWLWVVDPLDGTHNYSQGIPQFAYNIALCRDGAPVLGLTYSPATGDEFFAQAGGGLYVNGQPARASAVPSLAASVWGIDLGYHDDRASYLISLLAEIWPGVQSVRIIGTAALGLAYAACGRYDLFVHHYLYPWDIAPGIVQVREAGGVILDRNGGPVTIYSEGVIAGGAGPVQDFLRAAQGKPWR